jgi:hypothetical protein
MDIWKIVCHGYLLTVWGLSHLKVNSYKDAFLCIKDNVSDFRVFDRAQKYKCEKAKENESFL